MIREAVDDAIDDIIESGIDERDTDIEAIKVGFLNLYSWGKKD